MPGGTRAVIFKESLLPSLASKLGVDQLKVDNEAPKAGGVMGGAQGKGSQGSSHASPPSSTVDFISRGRPGRRQSRRNRSV
jgi:hypothetical protein